MNRKGIKNIYTAGVLVILSIFYNIDSAIAKKTISDAGTALEKAVNPTGLPKNEMAYYVGTVAQWMFGIMGLLFFGLMVYAGMLWFIARGEEEKIAESKKTIIAAIIGLALSTSAYAIATFVTGASGLN